MSAQVHRSRHRPRRGRGASSLPVALRALVLALVTGAPGACSPGAAASPAPGPVTLLFIGDSLTAGYGVSRTEAYPAQVNAALDTRGWEAQSINAGVSGATTHDALARLGESMRRHADVALVALGGNDGLRGQSVNIMARNLSTIVQRLQHAGVRVGLVGLRLPAPIPATYRREFEAAYEHVAEEFDIPLLRDLLEDVLQVPGRMQRDGLHPNAAGHAVMARRVLDFVLDEGLLHE